MAECAQKITPLAMFEHRVAQIAGRNEARRKSGDFNFFLLNDFIENVHLKNLVGNSGWF